MKYRIITILTIFIFTSSFVVEDELYLNYKASIQNESTFQYNLVVKIKNLNNGEIREICTDANGLLGALHREYNTGYDNAGVNKIRSIAIKNKSRYFEFKNKSALDNLGLQFYSIADLSEIEKRVNFDSIAKQILEQKKWQKSLDYDEMRMYAHALFNRKILTGENNCTGGTLYYVDRKHPMD